MSEFDNQRPPKSIQEEIEKPVEEQEKVKPREKLILRRKGR